MPSAFGTTKLSNAATGLTQTSCIRFVSTVDAAVIITAFAKQNISNT